MTGKWTEVDENERICMMAVGVLPEFCDKEDRDQLVFFFQRCRTYL